MLENRFEAVDPQILTANGTANGVVTLRDTSPFKVKQRLFIASATKPNLELEVKRINSQTEMVVGPTTGSILSVADISTYLVADGANVFAFEQKRPVITADEFERATYEEEPTVAKRVTLVDAFGNRVTRNNPLPLGFPIASMGAFNRLRVAAPTTLFDSKQVHDNRPMFWDDQQISGSGTSSTYNTNQASTTLAVSNNTAGMRARQTFRQLNYQPGKSQLVYMTFAMSSPPVAGIVRQIGQFNDHDGVFFEQNGTTLQFVRRSFVTGVAIDYPVTQAFWNLDPLDGSGPSGIVLDTTKVNILVIDYEWLGSGTIRFGFVLGGVIVYAHIMDNANNLPVVWCSNPNLPLRCSIINMGTGPAAGLTQISATSMTEGGGALDELGLEFAISRGATPLVTNNDANLYPMLAFRLRSGYNHAQVIPDHLSLLGVGNTDIEWRFLLNPTVTGTALNFTAITGSAIEADVGTTNATTVSGGVFIDGGYVTGAAEINLNLKNDFSPGVSIAGVADIMVLAVRRLTGSAQTVYGSITWHETE